MAYNLLTWDRGDITVTSRYQCGVLELQYFLPLLLSLPHLSHYNLMPIIELSNRVLQVRSTLKPDVEEYPSFSADGVILLFGDVARPVGLVLNHNNPRECFVIFPDSEYVPDILKLADSPKWVGTNMNLTIDRPRVEVIPIIVKLLEDKTLGGGEEYEYIPIEGGGTCCPSVGRTN